MGIYFYQCHVSLKINQENDIQLSSYQSSTHLIKHIKNHYASSKSFIIQDQMQYHIQVKLILPSRLCNL